MFTNEDDETFLFSKNCIMILLNFLNNKILNSNFGHEKVIENILGSNPKFVLNFLMILKFKIKYILL